MNMIPTEFDAILSLVGGRLSSGLTDDTRELEYTYHDGQKAPTQKEIDAELKKLQADYDALDYSRKRKAEFPSIQDLVVALYDTDDKSAVEAKRTAVKKKYPKPA